MTLPSSLNTLLEQLNTELNILQDDLAKATRLTRARMSLFPENIASIQLFAVLSNYDLFLENTRRRIQETLQYLTEKDSLSETEIHEAGEDLSEQLGRILEAKIVISNIRTRLEN
jgi:hypothetical protein